MDLVAYQSHVEPLHIGYLQGVSTDFYKLKAKSTSLGRRLAWKQGTEGEPLMRFEVIYHGQQDYWSIISIWA